MCGICGVIGIESKPTSEAIVRRMMASMFHRGPDEEGLLFSPPVAMGMRRLSIVDLPGGSQPLFNEKKTLAVVFNGEIYNFRELREEFEAAGHRFRTRSDTEVIVHAYESWGERCVEHLRGMFAFAVVEMPQGPEGRATRVFLARDQQGIKPLYYKLSDGKLLFASEVRTLLASGCVPARLCTASIPAYLLFGSVCEPATLVEGVNSLPPGYSITISLGAPIASVEPKCYWNFGGQPEGQPVADNGSRDSSRSPAEQVRTLLDRAVASQLVADVPVGVFLSSGLDSTAIAAIASRVQAGIHTFTVAFPDIEFSEAEKARRTATSLGTLHSELMISDQEMVARLEEAIGSFDQPSMDGINTYFVSWAARQAGLKVALSGLGSDELFGGYSSFKVTSTAARMAALGGFFPRPVRAMVADAFGRAPDRTRKAVAALREPESLPHPYFFTRLLFTPEAVSLACRGEAGHWEAQSWWRWLSDAAHEASSMDEFTGISWLELRSYMLNTLLRDTDAMSMRHSLEVRVPFLDLPLVECLLSLPESSKRGTGSPKALLVGALGDLLPPEVVNQLKRTFTFPWETWLRGDLGKRVAAGLWDWSPALESHIGGDFAQSVWRDYLGGRTSWSRPWSLYVLNEWVKRNIDGNSVSPDSSRAAVVVTS